MENNIMSIPTENLIGFLKEALGHDAALIEQVGDDIFVIQRLMYHCSLLINPMELGGYEQRYCYHNVELATIALEEYKDTGKFRYWKKDHTKNISVGCKNKLFNSGDLQTPENAIGEVDWDNDELEAIFTYFFDFT